MKWENSNSYSFPNRIMCRVLKFVLSFIQKLFIKGLLYINHYSGTEERFSEQKDKMFKGATVYHDLRMFESGRK